MRTIGWRGRVVAVLALGALALPASADPGDDIAQLRQEMARMRQSMEALEAKVRALEAEKTAPRAGPPVQPPSSYIALQRNWYEIEPGISKVKVEQLLGKPERELRINGDLVWYFVYPGLGRGSVFFNEADKVSAVQPPRIGWSW